MISGSIARRYAKALLELGQAHKMSELFGKDVDRVVELVEKSPELARTLENPVFAHSKRRAVLEDVVTRLGVQKLVRNFLLLLLDRNRIAALPAIAREHRALVDKAQGRVRATLTTAKPIDQMLELRIKAALEKSTGKTILLEKREDPSLLGGVVTQIGDMVYDGSVRAQLDDLRRTLLEQ